MKFATALRLESGAGARGQGAVVTFTGAGGKTTAMLALGRELAAQGLRVLALTTTRLGVEQLGRFPGFLVDPRATDIAVMLAQWRFLAVVSGIDRVQGKALGHPPEAIAGFRSLADVLLVEGDGSRGLPVKAPAPHEPVVPPDTTHLVNVANLAALGQPVGVETVHRPEIFAQVTGTKMGDPITPAVLARLLLHADGPARGAPAGAERFFLLNGAAPAAAAAERLASRLAAAPTTTAALLAEAGQEPPVWASYGKTAAVVLAAGSGSRFGSAKQLLEWRGQPLLRHVVLQTLAAPVHQVVVVLGAYYQETAAALQGLPVTLVYNPAWEGGQSTSMQAGLSSLGPGTQAVMFVLGDQPELPPDLLNALVAAHRHSLAPIVAPRFEGRRGNPVLFDRGCFADLQEVSGDTGGRALFETHQRDVVWIEAGVEVVRDIDRPQDVDTAGAG